jgi:hypothetical protein
MPAKKTKSYKPEYYDEEERRWRDWGEGFGRNMGAWGRGFGTEMKRQFGSKRKEEGERNDFGKHSWHCCEDDGGPCRASFGRNMLWPFGMIGPLLSSIFGIIVLIIGLWVLTFFNVILKSAFISLLVTAVSSNIQWFFAISLFIGYCKFFARHFPFTYWVLRPAASAAGISFGAWILSWLLRVLGTYSRNASIVDLGVLLRANLALVFIAALALSFVGVMMKGAFGCKRGRHGE